MAQPSSLPAFGGLTLVGCPVPTKAALSLPLLSWTGERKYNESLVGRGRDHSLITVTGKTDSAWGNQFNLLPNKLD